MDIPEEKRETQSVLYGQIVVRKRGPGPFGGDFYITDVWEAPLSQNSRHFAGAMSSASWSEADAVCAKTLREEYRYPETSRWWFPYLADHLSKDPRSYPEPLPSFPDPPRHHPWWAFWRK